MVITIIGILIALLLPAVQAAREAARQAQCKNNLKQLALGCLNHEQLMKQLPTDGWGDQWTGDPDRGTDWRQPGGWMYNVLPYIEQQALHDMGAGLPWNDTQKKNYNMQRLSTPVGTLYCPTRRPAIAYPWLDAGCTPVNATHPTVVGRSDYAASGGDVYTGGPYPQNPAWATAPPNVFAGPASVTEVENPPGQMTANARTTFANYAGSATGVFFTGSMTKMADITDGTSNTYLIGEKYLNPDNYATGMDNGDNEAALVGDIDDILRWVATTAPPASTTASYLPPAQDTPGNGAYFGFGSAHANGFQMAFCDGSVQMMNYTIDPETHRRLGNRKDGYAIDGKKL